MGDTKAVPSKYVTLLIDRVVALEILIIRDLPEKVSSLLAEKLAGAVADRVAHEILRRFPHLGDPGSLAVSLTPAAPPVQPAGEDEAPSTATASAESVIAKLRRPLFHNDPDPAPPPAAPEYEPIRPDEEVVMATPDQQQRRPDLTYEQTCCQLYRETGRAASDLDGALLAAVFDAAIRETDGLDPVRATELFLRWVGELDIGEGPHDLAARHCWRDDR